MPQKKTEAPAPATIVVVVPADARLSIDGNMTNATSARRTFVSPTLEMGADYYYTLTAEVIREGRTYVQTQRVTVRAGETTEVPFNFSLETVASR